MTRSDSFNDEEWNLLGDAPLAAATAVALSSEGGGEREADTIVNTWRAAYDRFAQHELLGEIIRRLDPERRPSREGVPYTYATIEAEAINLCAQAAVLLQQRATAEEIAAYSEFVLSLAEQVARANREGGLFGIGGAAISSAEQDMLVALRRALMQR